MARAYTHATGAAFRTNCICYLPLLSKLVGMLLQQLQPVGQAALVMCAVPIWNVK